MTPSVVAKDLERAELRFGGLDDLVTAISLMYRAASASAAG
jgi:hypothetical protein